MALLHFGFFTFIGQGTVRIQPGNEREAMQQRSPGGAEQGELAVLWEHSAAFNIFGSGLKNFFPVFNIIIMSNSTSSSLSAAEKRALSVNLHIDE